MLASNVYATHIKATVHFEQEYAATVTNFYFKLGDLILFWNTAIEKSLNHKMHARYLGLSIVISCNRGSAYIHAELNGSVFNCAVTAFQVIPYVTCHHIDIPPLNKLIDISTCQLCELEDSTTTDPEDESDDPTMDDESPPDPQDDNEDWGTV